MAIEDMSMENFPASFRSMPCVNAAAMVEPEREMPGTMANACATPMTTASSQFILASGRG